MVTTTTLIILKHILLLFFSYTSNFFLVPPEYFFTPPPHPHAHPHAHVTSGYSPATCNVTNYDFTFIYDDTYSAFKVHGLWAEQCSECVTCGYPFCCNAINMTYVYPSKPNQIAFLNAQWYNATTHEECSSNRDTHTHTHTQTQLSTTSESSESLVSLFEHEFFKHASCSPMRVSASDFVDQVMQLYTLYYNTHVENQCSGYKQLWLNLDSNFQYNNVTKCL